MNAQDAADFDDHEMVRFHDLGAGARAIIAVHSTHRGPAVGGCRVWRYPVATQALSDALRLSRGMSYKNAMADLPFGGGKAVILPPPGPFERRMLFEAFGRAVNELGGRYITAEDVGSTVADMQIIATQTQHVGGLPRAVGRAGGDPSPWTALGVFLSIEAALRWRLGRPVEGAKVTVQGVGAVGQELCRLLVEAGATVTVGDIDAERAMIVARRVGAQVAEPHALHRLAADVFAPCALGAGLNEKTVDEIAAPIICGGANNQLSDAAVGEALSRRGKLYCPDYVVNAGGIIAVHGEAAGWTIGNVATAVSAIPQRLVEILIGADRLARPPEVIADAAARDRIGRGAGKIRADASSPVAGAR